MWNFFFVFLQTRLVGLCVSLRQPSWMSFTKRFLISISCLFTQHGYRSVFLSLSREWLNLLRNTKSKLLTIYLSIYLFDKALYDRPLSILLKWSCTKQFKMWVGMTNNREITVNILLSLGLDLIRYLRSLIQNVVSRVGYHEGELFRC